MCAVDDPDDVAGPGGVDDPDDVAGPGDVDDPIVPFIQTVLDWARKLPLSAVCDILKAKKINVCYLKDSYTTPHHTAAHSTQYTPHSGSLHTTHTASPEAGIYIFYY